MDYSKTVNLPKTSFPMKADLPHREPGFQKYWEEIRLYEQLATRETAKGTFVLHDGPPYSNGDIHIGHALNKILKDIIVRYKAMSGYRTPFVPGWDNHGMPIENKVMDEFRRKGESPDRLAIRKACREYAAKWVNRQREQFKRLGCIGDWNDPYLTMSTEYEAAIIKVFGELAEQGYIYRGLKPIHWCIFDETALAEAEIEYEDHTSPSIFVRFPLAKDPNGLFGEKPKDNCFTIIWTTTPWTIPANLAVAVHPDYDYAFVDAGSNRYLIAAELVVKTMAAAKVESFSTVKIVKGSELAGMVFKHPIYDRDSVLVHASYVTLDEGTGVVHTAPGHGREDFETGRQYGLDVLCPVDEKGYFTKEAGQFAGLHITKQGNDAVIKALREAGHLLAEDKVVHSYPHCWRCHNPVIFRTTVQWFLALDHMNLRQRIIEAIESIEFYPKETKNRLRTMIENSPDWCLSRQRSWGVGIPVFFCAECGEPVMTRETIEAVYKDALENGSDSWFEKPTEELLPARVTCPKCGFNRFWKETDVLDVWFDSGSSCRAVLEGHWKLGYPADMYLEGSDQHRGWFNKSLIVGLATKGSSPFRELVTHGFTLDAEGRKMAKTLGNVIAPQQVIRDVGADVLRLFFASCDYFEDVRIGDEMLTRVTDAYRRIRNTFRFILGNLFDFDPAVDCVPYEQMLELDRFALHRLQQLVRQTKNAYESYQFHKVYHAVHEYCAVDLSSFYLDVLKDRMYISAQKSLERRSAQTALHGILSTLVRIVAPILVHTCEEVWQEMRDSGKAQSVHLASFPEVDESLEDPELERNWTRILELRDKVLSALEQARQSGVIGKPLESKVCLTVPKETYDFLQPYADMLASVFIVSQVDLREGESEEIEVQPPPGSKCERCWLVLESVGKHSEHPTLCDRCVEALRTMEIER
ncbi:MAG: isoleucine--tRNA ligase [Armatimonadota bacterium]|nr:isoleucine--tRNA ligase [Armatimonadota bacterium]